MTPESVLSELLAGNQRFSESRPVNPHHDLLRVQQVAEHQTPSAVILGCADSRVPPEVIFDQGIGDLFVIRNAGHQATLEDIASVEYAVAVLGSKVVLVLGHERCGAVSAALAGAAVPGIIEALFFGLRPAVELARQQAGDLVANTVRQNVGVQVKRLLVSEVIKKAVVAGELLVVGGYYGLKTGLVTLL
ncbi:carbonic anhydrase [Gloeomargarita lithophora Alchichica-D10]|uniref:Carbonic anhydrase n=1 Tax=Gloeomargarita lithophora Alchichica-D10 TaxID=1188229 RepID=A0A1J0ADB5_9CYAN|nr:carbonic anhydrase [Gloeomargarita lithophora]APB33930.1 carbonic anhydrase [Gloeomargarita lithophora Alchichica-D10]